MLAEPDVDALHADRATRVDDDEPHLADAAHHAHRLIWLGQHVVLARPRQLAIEQNRQDYMRDCLRRIDASGTSRSASLARWHGVAGSVRIRQRERRRRLADERVEVHRDIRTADRP